MHIDPQVRGKGDSLRCTFLGPSELVLLGLEWLPEVCFPNKINGMKMRIAPLALATSQKVSPCFEDAVPSPGQFFIG